MKYLILLLFPLPFLSEAQDFAAYKNYDFVAGEKTIFEDNFQYGASDKPLDKWQVLGGKASLYLQNSEACMSIDEYYTKLRPLLFGGKALPDSFSVEYDTWLDNGYDGNPGIEIHFLNGDKEIIVTPNKHEMTVTYPGDGREAKENPEAYFGENRFYDRWVHISIAVYHKQLTGYLDQYKMIELSDCRLKPLALTVTGNSSQSMKILLRNFRIATGFPGKLILDKGKFVTRGIRFDVNKSTLKPESITVIRMIKQYLDQNPSVSFEIGGHTDSDGDDAYNLKLSQERAEAVKNQLVKMGVNASRLTARGFGESKPLAPNTSPEAKANNRRVEFTQTN